MISKPQGNLVNSMKIISSKEILKNKLFTVVDEVARDNSGFEIHRNIVRHPGSAVMMAVDETERILLVKQFRLPAAKDLWELPAGRIDPDLTPGEPRPMGDERIEVAWYTRKQIAALIHSGKMEDGKTLVGYFMWLEYRKAAKHHAQDVRGAERAAPKK